MTFFMQKITSNFEEAVNSVPSNFEEAINSVDREKWISAMKNEMNSLKENETWKLVEKSNQKVINCRWVFTKKENDVFKARLVIKGYAQTEGIDYKETFSPVVRFDTVRFLMSIAARQGLKLGKFDIKTAFLYGTLIEEIFMKQPEGFSDGTSRVCKLLKSLYGLKQAPRCWSEEFTKFLESLGFCRSKADPCLFIYEKDGTIILIAVFVDDGFVVASSIRLIEGLFNNLKKKFQITCTLNVENFLGVEIHRSADGSILLHQESYAKKVLERFKMLESNSMKTPIECGWNDKDLSKSACNVPYREAVGNLMYLAVVTRPDISFAVNVASRALENPTERHWSLVKRIMRYIKGTLDVGLLYQKSGNFVTYSDADYAGDCKTRKSTSGMVCMNASAAITWQSKRQQCVALSTTEAEYVSASAATKEIVWMRKLFEDCKILNVKYVLHVDNMSAIKLIKNPEFHERTKHIDIKYHYVRNAYKDGVMDVEYINTDEQIADIFTKALSKPKFEYFVHMLGLKSKTEMIQM